MTDTPKTLSLSAREWNALMASNAADLHAVFQSQPEPNADLYLKIITHMDRMKAILPGWLAAAPAPVSGEAQAAAPVPVEAATDVPKKRGGWPKGKPRVRNGAAQAVQ